MNELSLFKPEEKVMTTRELSEMFAVTERTIRDTAKSIGVEGTFHTMQTNGGFQQVKVFNEKQATLIKQEIQKHHNLASRQIDAVTTEYEENQTIANAMMILKRRNDELKKRAEIAESALKRIADGKGCYSMNQTAKALKLPFGNIKLFERLRNEGILNADNTPRQEQINAGHFKVVVKFINEEVGNKSVTLTTGKGLVYLAKKFNTEIDESVMADA